jgi:hypothetical protein
MLSMVTNTVASDREQLNRGIERGVRFLKETQDHKRGTWKGPSTYPGGATALCTLALLESGVPDTDPSVKRALTHLGSLDAPRQTYTAAIQTMAFCGAGGKPYANLIKRNISILERLQLAEGPTQGGWSYTAAKGAVPHADPSNSRFALLALSAAKRSGFDVRAEVWNRALVYWLRAQNDDGSWSYRAGEMSGTGSMTCAGIVSLVIARKYANAASGRDVEQRIERAERWMARSFSVTKNPGSTSGRWLFYYLDTLARAGSRTEENRFGEHDWFEEGADFLLRSQSFDGSWEGDIRGLPQISTSFALMFLSAKATGSRKSN